LARTAILVGAGVIGVSSAYALARRGWNVTLVDGASGPAMGTSHANGAQLSYCYTDALGSPAVLASLPRLLSGKGGVSFGLHFNPAYFRWAMQFALNCSASKFRSNTLALLELAAQSKRAMDALCDQHDLDFAHRTAGKINLLYSAKDQDHAAGVRAIKQTAQHGQCEQDIIDRDALYALDPALTGLDPDVIGAVSTPSEVVGDPFLFCTALLEVLMREYGAQTRFGSEVVSVQDSAGTGSVMLADGERLTADCVVIASGIDSNRLLAPLGQAEAIQPMKGYSFEMPATSGSPCISVTDGKRRLVFTNLGERIRVAGIAQLGNGTRTIDDDRIQWLIDSARECLPKGGDYSQAGRFWAGLRPATPNSQPVIRRASAALAINTGHGALGWTLAMGSAERLADLLSD
jgi:D-amino-acid dehydrogenase